MTELRTQLAELMEEERCHRERGWAIQSQIRQVRDQIDAVEKGPLQELWTGRRPYEKDYGVTLQSNLIGQEAALTVITGYLNAKNVNLAMADLRRLQGMITQAIHELGTAATSGQQTDQSIDRGPKLTRRGRR